MKEEVPGFCYLKEKNKKNWIWDGNANQTL
jgi:hypothetical protein